MNLEGKTFVIMGVANKRSIAWGAARALDQMGAKLVFTILNERFRRELDKLVGDLEGDHDVIVECDVTNDEQVEAAFDEIKEKTGGIDGVLHAIAYAGKDELQGGYSETTREGFKNALDISAYSLAVVSKHAKTIMNEGGSIVTMTYLGGERAMPNYNVMGVAKAALESSVRYLALDLGESGIRVNAVSARTDPYTEFLSSRRLQIHPEGNRRTCTTQAQRRSARSRQYGSLPAQRPRERHHR